MALGSSTCPNALFVWGSCFPARCLGQKGPVIHRFCFPNFWPMMTEQCGPWRRELSVLPMA